MPWRRYHRRSRRSSALPLVGLLIIAVLLLLFLNNRGIIPPNMTIPITGLPTGLPQVQVPTVQIPITIIPGTLVPQIGIEGTPGPIIPSSGGAALGQRSKTSGCQVQGALPDAACTPGAVMSSDANQICQKDYASSVRNVPTSLKNQVYKEYGIASHASGQYEVDHLVSLELGGSNDIANLWPEAASPRPGFHEKDRVENYLHDQVCSGAMSLADAQRQVATNWLAVYNQMTK